MNNHIFFIKFFLLTKCLHSVAMGEGGWYRANTRHPHTQEKKEDKEPPDFHFY